MTLKKLLKILGCDKLFITYNVLPDKYNIPPHLLDNEALETKYHRNYHLDDVIAKLETDSDYWKKATLKFELMSNTRLFKLLKDSQLK